MYRISYSHPITGNYCSRTFKSLHNAYKHIRDFVTEMTFEVIPIGVGECYYVHYSLLNDKFIFYSKDVKVLLSLEDINDGK